MNLNELLKDCKAILVDIVYVDRKTGVKLNFDLEAPITSCKLIKPENGGDALLHIAFNGTAGHSGNEVTLALRTANGKLQYRFSEWTDDDVFSDLSEEPQVVADFRTFLEYIEDEDERVEVAIDFEY